jgi:hypothetical protein
MQRRVSPAIPFLSHLSALAAPSGGAAAKKGQGAVKAPGMDFSFGFFDAGRFKVLGGLNDAGRVAIASANDWDGGRVESDDSGGRISARRGEGSKGGGGSSSWGGEWLRNLSAAPPTPPE